MKRILIWATTLLVTNAGSWLFRGCEISRQRDEIKVYAATIKKDSVLKSELSSEVEKFRQKDLSNQFFIDSKETVLIQMRNINREQNKELIYLREWKHKAEINGIITDTVRVKKRLFRKGFKIVD